MAPHPPLLASLLFDPPEPKHNSSRLSYLFAHLHLLSSHSFSSLILSLLLSDSSHLCFMSEVWLPNFLRFIGCYNWCLQLWFPCSTTTMKESAAGDLRFACPNLTPKLLSPNLTIFISDIVIWSIPLGFYLIFSIMSPSYPNHIPMLPQREFTNVSINLVMRIVALIARGGPSSGGKRRRHTPLLFGCAISLHLGP